MSKHVFLLGAGFLLVGLAFIVTDRLHSDPVTKANCDRIRERTKAGITEEEVQALLGRPPDEAGRNDNGEPVGPFRVWRGRHGSIRVWLSEGDARRVESVFFRDAREGGFLDRFRAWLGW